MALQHVVSHQATQQLKHLAAILKKLVEILLAQPQLMNIHVLGSNLALILGRVDLNLMSQ